MSEKDTMSKPKWPVINQAEYDEQLRTPWHTHDAPWGEEFSSLDARAPGRVGDMMDLDDLFWHASMRNEKATEELLLRMAGDKVPTIYRCIGGTDHGDQGCSWIGSGEASAAAHHEKTGHDCVLWEDATPEELHAVAEAYMEHERELRKYLMKRRTDRIALKREDAGKGGV